VLGSAALPGLPTGTVAMVTAADAMPAPTSGTLNASAKATHKVLRFMVLPSFRARNTSRPGDDQNDMENCRFKDMKSQRKGNVIALKNASYGLIY
jgi:hypothetical protein